MRTSALALRRAVAAFRRHRASIALGDEAAARLGEIRASRAAPGTDDRRVPAWMTECRFGFMQALRAWKDNEAARAGLDDCFELMIEHEPAQRDVGGARALHADLRAERPDLARRIDALAAELREAAARGAAPRHRA
jgi:hypothetical protein